MKNLVTALFGLAIVAAGVGELMVTAAETPSYLVYRARVEGRSGSPPVFVEDVNSAEGQILWVAAEGSPMPGTTYKGKLTARPGGLVTCTCPDDEESCYCSFIK